MLQSGIKLFRERGIHGTAFADVLADSGAPRGSVYHHFPGGREQFVAEAIRAAGGFVTGLLKELLEQTNPADAVDRFSAMWAQLLLASDLKAGCPILAAVVEGGGFPEAGKTARKVFADWQALVAGTCKRHGVAPDQAEAFATLTIAAFEGAVVLCRAQGDLKPLRQVTERLRVMADSLLP
jgi:TetR/AcrR family transcriptional repressor of lmrAB and yxaGH operons